PSPPPPSPSLLFLLFVSLFLSATDFNERYAKSIVASSKAKCTEAELEHGTLALQSPPAGPHPILPLFPLLLLFLLLSPLLFFFLSLCHQFRLAALSIFSLLQDHPRVLCSPEASL